MLEEKVEEDIQNNKEEYNKVENKVEKKAENNNIEDLAFISILKNKINFKRIIILIGKLYI